MCPEKNGALFSATRFSAVPMFKPSLPPSLPPCELLLQVARQVVKTGGMQEGPLKNERWDAWQTKLNLGILECWCLYLSSTSSGFYFSGDWDVHWGYDLAFDPQSHSEAKRRASGQGEFEFVWIQQGEHLVGQRPLKQSNVKDLRWRLCKFLGGSQPSGSLAF